MEIQIYYIIGLLFLLMSLYTIYEGFDSKKSIVLFHTPWCGHCKRLKPVWNELLQKHKEDKTVELKSIDCEAQPDMAKRYGINSFPTIIAFTGSQQRTFQGERTLANLEAFIK